MSRQGDKARAAWLDRCRAALIDAAGAAVCAGLIDTARQINAMALDIDRKTCYTDTRQRRQARKDEEAKIMKKIKVFWENAECALNPGTPCIFAWADLPNGEQIGAEYALSDDDFDSPEDCEPSEDADRRAAVYLRAEITKQAEASGYSADTLDFQF